MTSSNSFQYLSRFKFELPYLLSNLDKFWHRSILRRWFWIWRKSSEGERCHFSWKPVNFDQVLINMATPLIILDWKLFQMMLCIIILKVRKFHLATPNRFATARQKPVCPRPPPAWIGLNSDLLSSQRPLNGLLDADNQGRRNYLVFDRLFNWNTNDYCLLNNIWFILKRMWEILIRRWRFRFRRPWDPFIFVHL